MISRMEWGGQAWKCIKMAPTERARGDGRGGVLDFETATSLVLFWREMKKRGNECDSAGVVIGVFFFWYPA